MPTCMKTSSKFVFALLSLVAIASSAGCESESKPLSPEARALVGQWRSTSYALEFDSDGNFRGGAVDVLGQVSIDAGGGFEVEAGLFWQMVGTAAQGGPYLLDGDRLFLEVMSRAADDPGIETGVFGTWHVDGQVDLVVGGKKTRSPYHVKLTIERPRFGNSGNVEILRTVNGQEGSDSRSGASFRSFPDQPDTIEVTSLEGGRTKYKLMPDGRLAREPFTRTRGLSF